MDMFPSDKYGNNPNGNYKRFFGQVSGTITNNNSGNEAFYYTGGSYKGHAGYIDNKGYILLYTSNPVISDIYHVAGRAYLSW